MRESEVVKKNLKKAARVRSAPKQPFPWQRADSVSNHPNNVWKERKEFYESAKPKSVDEEELMIHEAIERSKLDVQEEELCKKILEEQEEVLGGCQAQAVQDIGAEVSFLGTPLRPPGYKQEFSPPQVLPCSPSAYWGGPWTGQSAERASSSSRQLVDSRDSTPDHHTAPKSHQLVNGTGREGKSGMGRGRGRGRGRTKGQQEAECKQGGALGQGQRPGGWDERRGARATVEEDWDEEIKREKEGSGARACIREIDTEEDRREPAVHKTVDVRRENAVIDKLFDGRRENAVIDNVFDGRRENAVIDKLFDGHRENAVMGKVFDVEDGRRAGVLQSPGMLSGGKGSSYSKDLPSAWSTLGHELSIAKSSAKSWSEEGHGAVNGACVPHGDTRLYVENELLHSKVEVTVVATEAVTNPQAVNSGATRVHYDQRYLNDSRCGAVGGVQERMSNGRKMVGSRGNSAGSECPVEVPADRLKTLHPQVLANTVKGGVGSPADLPTDHWQSLDSVHVSSVQSDPSPGPWSTGDPPCPPANGSLGSLSANWVLNPPGNCTMVGWNLPDRSVSQTGVGANNNVPMQTLSDPRVGVQCAGPADSSCSNLDWAADCENKALEGCRSMDYDKGWLHSSSSSSLSSSFNQRHPRAGYHEDQPSAYSSRSSLCGDERLEGFYPQAWAVHPAMFAADSLESKVMAQNIKLDQGVSCPHSPPHYTQDGLVNAWLNTGSQVNSNSGEERLSPQSVDPAIISFSRKAQDWSRESGEGCNTRLMGTKADPNDSLAQVVGSGDHQTAGSAVRNQASGPVTHNRAQEERADLQPPKIHGHSRKGRENEAVGPDTTDSRVQRVSAVESKEQRTRVADGGKQKGVADAKGQRMSIAEGTEQRMSAVVCHDETLNPEGNRRRMIAESKRPQESVEEGRAHRSCTENKEQRTSILDRNEQKRRTTGAREQRITASESSDQRKSYAVEREQRVNVAVGNDSIASNITLAKATPCGNITKTPTNGPASYLVHNAPIAGSASYPIHNAPTVGSASYPIHNAPTASPASYSPDLPPYPMHQLMFPVMYPPTAHMLHTPMMNPLTGMHCQPYLVPPGTFPDTIPWGGMIDPMAANMAAAFATAAAAMQMQQGLRFPGMVPGGFVQFAPRAFVMPPHFSNTPVPTSSIVMSEEDAALLTGAQMAEAPHDGQ